MGLHPVTWQSTFFFFLPPALFTPLVVKHWPEIPVRSSHHSPALSQLVRGSGWKKWEHEYTTLHEHTQSKVRGFCENLFAVEDLGLSHHVLADWHWIIFALPPGKVIFSHSHCLVYWNGWSWSLQRRSNMITNERSLFRCLLIIHEYVTGVSRANYPAKWKKTDDDLFATHITLPGVVNVAKCSLPKTQVWLVWPGYFCNRFLQINRHDHAGGSVLYWCIKV